MLSHSNSVIKTVICSYLLKSLNIYVCNLHHFLFLHAHNNIQQGVKWVTFLFFFAFDHITSIINDVFTHENTAYIGFTFKYEKLVFLPLDYRHWKRSNVFSYLVPHILWSTTFSALSAKCQPFKKFSSSYNFNADQPF